MGTTTKSRASSWFLSCWQTVQCRLHHR